MDVRARCIGSERVGQGGGRERECWARTRARGRARLARSSPTHASALLPTRSPLPNSRSLLWPADRYTTSLACMQTSCSPFADLSRQSLAHTTCVSGSTASFPLQRPVILGHRVKSAAYEGRTGLCILQPVFSTISLYATVRCASNRSLHPPSPTDRCLISSSHSPDPLYPPSPP